MNSESSGAGLGFKSNFAIKHEQHAIVADTVAGPLKTTQTPVVNRELRAMKKSINWRETLTHPFELYVNISEASNRDWRVQHFGGVIGDKGVDAQRSCAVEPDGIVYGPDHDRESGFRRCV